MRELPIRWRVFLPLALVVGLSLLAAGPFITRPGLPGWGDFPIHVYRAAEIGHILRDGVPFSRWAPDFYLGYGYPIFNYYPPLTYYLANLFALVPGWGIVAGVKAIFVLGMVLAGVGMYLWVRRTSCQPALQETAAVVAAVAYVYAPYLLLVDTYMRGNLAESFALGLAPWVFWAWERFLRWAHWGDGMLAAVLLAALVLSHALMGVCLGVLLVVWVAVWMVGGRWGAGRLGAGRLGAGRLGVGRWGMVIGAGMLALGLTAFFWLPVLLERDLVRLGEVIGTGDYDFHRHFLSLGELVAPVPILDLGAVNPRFRYNLGLAQWILAALSVVTVSGSLVVNRKSANRKLANQRISESARILTKSPHATRNTQHAIRNTSLSLISLSLVTLFLLFLMLPLSTLLWERVPGMGVLQFPWRLLGPVALLLAWLVGMGARWVQMALPGRWRAVGLGAMLVMLLVTALPAMYPPMWEPAYADTSPRGIIQQELDGIFLGTTANGEYTPRWVRLGPRATPSLLRSYEGPGPVDKLDYASLPPEATAQVVRHWAIGDEFRVETPRPFSLRVLTFYFPGWRAWIDGTEIAVRPSEPEGFIVVDVPAGRHTVVLRFGDTPPRVIGNAVSLVSLVVVIVGGIITNQQIGKSQISKLVNW